MKGIPRLAGMLLLGILIFGMLPACTLLRPAAEKTTSPAPPPTSTAKIHPPEDIRLTDVAVEEDLFPPSAWADSVLSTLDWRRTIAQLLVPFTYSELTPRVLGRMRTAARDHGVGGVLISRGTVADARVLIDSLQSWSVVPMLVSADFEHGPGMRLEGGLRLPSMMAMAATRDLDLVYRAGRAVAEESRRIGVLLNFAPVADVNNNPRNPIINTRSFGEQPELVGDMAEAYMRGMQDGGLIATAKHFPGHGDTHVDSHTGLPLIGADAARLDSIELLPFRRLIDAGVLAVMSGHLAVPALTGDSILPATLSASVMDTLLRRKLGFRGLVITDAMNMKALTRTKVANLPAAAVNAGADILLIPGELGETIDSISAAAARGEIDSARIRRSVRRILEAKHMLSLWSGKSSEPDVSSEPGRLDEEIAEGALTLVRNSGGLLPLADSSDVVVVSFVRKGEPKEALAFIAGMRTHFPRTRALIIDRRPRGDMQKTLHDSLRGARVVVLAVHLSVVNASGSIGLSAEQQRLLMQIEQLRLPRVLLALGTPYVLEAIPSAEAMVCAYGDDPAGVDAAVRVLSGELSPKGRLPVHIPGVAAFGDGFGYPRPAAEASVYMHLAFRRVDSLILDQIGRRSMPGAQLAVVRGDSLLYLKSYGRHSYDSVAAVVDDSTLYDLASLTKVVVTATAAMQLIDEGRLHLDSAVASYLPEFAVNGKGSITVRNLLLHNSGLQAFRPFHQHPGFANAVANRAVLDSILGSAPVYAPGSKTVYSDFGMIVLAEAIERITGSRLDEYARERIFSPLGMRHSMFVPPDSIHYRCAPTEVDPVWRKRLLRGSVHDETAALLGGVAGHAGMFSTASDLARFVRLLLGGGSFDGLRVVASATVAQFTGRQSPQHSRALGWDLRSTSGSSSGRYFSMKSFGHTGFTGTSIWVDPAAQVAVVFLTNRVHPTRENKQLPRFRASLHDAVREALAKDK